MTGITIALALVSAGCFGLALVIAQLGLRYMPPIAGRQLRCPRLHSSFCALRRSCYTGTSRHRGERRCCSPWSWMTLAV